MINSLTIGNRLSFFIEIKMKLRAILEGLCGTQAEMPDKYGQNGLCELGDSSQFFFSF